MTTFRVLLLALGIDNFGSGLFLPLTVIWLTHRVGLSLPTAGLVLTAGPSSAPSPPRSPLASSIASAPAPSWWQPSCCRRRACWPTWRRTVSCSPSSAGR